MRMQGRKLGWGLAVGVWLLAAMSAHAEDRRREPQTCEARCDDEAQRCREICKKYAGDGSDECLTACGEEEKRCKRQCKEASRR
jgi:hypothetical protein